MKLKTLEDFQDKGDCGDCEEGVLCCCMEIKQEAIKWVKCVDGKTAGEQYRQLESFFIKIYGDHLRKYRHPDSGIESMRLYGIDLWTAKKIIDDMLIYFFNITEDDLT